MYKNTWTDGKLNINIVQYLLHTSWNKSSTTLPAIVVCSICDKSSTRTYWHVSFSCFMLPLILACLHLVLHFWASFVTQCITFSFVSSINICISSVLFMSHSIWSCDHLCLCDFIKVLSSLKHYLQLCLIQNVAVAGRRFVLDVFSN